MKARLTNCRAYGEAPFRVALLHGGPGAPGYMAPVARELAKERGVLEPLQTADTLEGQIEELRAVLEARAVLPVTLVGSSWGAMLGYLFAARHPEHVRKLIMIGSAVFTAHTTRIRARGSKDRSPPCSATSASSSSRSAATTPGSSGVRASGSSRCCVRSSLSPASGARVDSDR